MGVPPMPETCVLYDMIITDTLTRAERASTPTMSQAPVVPHSTAVVPLLPFAGRAAEMQQLKTLTSSGKLILIEGEPGIGKTRLAEEFIAALSKSRSKPLLILLGVAHELEQGLPYQPIIDALRSLLSQPEWRSLRADLLAPMWIAEVARLIPELLNEFPHVAPATQLAEESRVWEGLYQFLMGLTRQRFVVLLLDDLHWADVSTIGWLSYMLHRAPSSSLLVLGAPRPIEAQSKLALMLQALRRVDRLTHLSLAPLSAHDLAAMAERLSPAHGDLLSRWLMHNSEGNPFFATELVRYAYISGVLEKNGSLDLRLDSTAHR
jgi:predicted ATPase